MLSGAIFRQIQPTLSQFVRKGLVRTRYRINVLSENRVATDPRDQGRRLSWAA